MPCALIDLRSERNGRRTSRQDLPTFILLTPLYWEPTDGQLRIIDPLIDILMIALSVRSRLPMIHWAIAARSTGSEDQRSGGARGIYNSKSGMS